VVGFLQVGDQVVVGHPSNLGTGLESGFHGIEIRDPGPRARGNTV